jgi:hypothetical protein
MSKFGSRARWFLNTRITLVEKRNVGSRASETSKKKIPCCPQQRGQWS